jgi:hypothetical protein
MSHRFKLPVMLLLRNEFQNKTLFVCLVGPQADSGLCFLKENRGLCLIQGILTIFMNNAKVSEVITFDILSSFGPEWDFLLAYHK